VQDSPAEKAGVLPGDVILQVGGRKIDSLDDVLNAAFYMTAGEEVPLTVSRGGRLMDIKVVPSANPLAPPEVIVPPPDVSLREPIEAGK
jgi:S1-C subfamily serine protease